MKKLTIIFHIAAIALCAVSCRIDPSDSRLSDRDIRFDMHFIENPSSKALLESEDLFVSGTRVKVYGFADDDLVGHTTTTGETRLNDGQTIEYSPSNGWAFISNNGESYQWKNGQTHKFYGYLSEDASSDIEAASFFGTGFSLTNDVLTIPQKTMGIDDDNLDFAYSDIVIRSSTAANYSVVDLPLNHLFASFGLSATNYTSSQVTITGIVLHGLVDNKSAAVDFSGTEPSVTYSSGSVADPYTLFSGSCPLSAAGNIGDSKANVISTPSSTPVYYLVWPQTISEITYAGTVDADGVPAPGTTDVNEPYLEINYNQGGAALSAYAPIPHDPEGWLPGVRHEMELSFRDREIDLGFKAADWDKLEPVIDYEGAVSVKTPLKLATGFYNSCILSSTGDTAFFKGAGIPIVLEFAIGTPENATWIVGKKLDWDAFDVYNYPDGARTDPDEIVTAEGLVDGNLARIAIDPPTGDLQKSEFALRLTFSVRLNNGEMVSIEDQDIFDPGCPKTFIYIKQ